MEIHNGRSDKMLDPNYNYSQLIEEIAKTNNPDQREVLQAKADALRPLVDKVVALGLNPRYAVRRNCNWLIAFIEIEDQEWSKLYHERGRAGLQAGALARRNFGV
jgi:hypothetical protein